MRGLRLLIAAMILIGGWWVAATPSVYEPIFSAIRDEVIANEDSPIIGMQTEEDWLVVVVDFDESPATTGKDVAAAERLMTSSTGVSAYFSDMTAARTTLNATVHPTVHRAASPANDYGADADDRRDVGRNGVSGPSQLVEEAMTGLFHNGDLTPWDLNADGHIDRLLILHTGSAQEDGGGNSAIWSHYAPLSVPFEAGGVTVGHYTLASFSSGLGTTVHEMIHMLGAWDLYDVHSDAPTSDWNGLGDWDIMASGNWNDNGRTPALPSAATLHQIGALNPISISVGERGEESHNFTLRPHVSDSGAVRIEIAPGEYVWLELRRQTGFDRHLAGEGLLVTQQNVAPALSGRNEVNRDPDTAWLKVIEADGDGGLLRGANSGVAGDLFHWTGTTTFGAEGIPIFDSRGRQVHWTIEITNGSFGGGFDHVDINLRSTGRGHADILPPVGPLRLLTDESIPLTFTARETCTPWASVESSDGRNIQMSSARELVPGESAVFHLEWVEESTSGASGQVTGSVGCGMDAAMQIRIDWSFVGCRLLTSEFEGVIPVHDPTQVSVPLEFEGDQAESYTVVVEGALGRIASVDSPRDLGPGDVLTIDVDPQGLLVPGMIARGEVQLFDNEGMAASFNITLQAEPPEGAGGAIMWLANPANNLRVVSTLMALWVILGGRARSPPIVDGANQVRPVPVHPVDVGRDGEEFDAGSDGVHTFYGGQLGEDGR